MSGYCTHLLVDIYYTTRSRINWFQYKLCLCNQLVNGNIYWCIKHIKITISIINTWLGAAGFDQSCYYEYKVDVYMVYKYTHLLYDD